MQPGDVPYRADSMRQVRPDQPLWLPLVPCQTLFNPPRTQLDLRVSKPFESGARLRLRADLNGYNVTDSSAVYSPNHNYGSQWQRPIRKANCDERTCRWSNVEFGGRFGLVGASAVPRAQREAFRTIVAPSGPRRYDATHGSAS